VKMSAWRKIPDCVPVTVLTGFLGSGKTTLFNHILTSSHGKKIAVIQNEFGDVSVDDLLMAEHTKLQTDKDIIEVLNGCICCAVRKDLAALLRKLAERQESGELFLDAIVIETTGMADPAPVAQTFLLDDRIKAFARLDGVVTMVDAKHIEQHLNEEKVEGAVNEAACQVAFADRLLLNKVDLVPLEADLSRIEERLRRINPFAPIQRCTKSQVSVSNVLNIHSFDLQRALKQNPGLLDVQSTITKHDTSVTSHSIDQGAARHLRVVDEGELDFALVQKWIGELLHSKGADIYRMKGVLAIAHASQRFVFHAVHMLTEGSFAEEWGEGEPRESKLVLIGKNIDVNALNSGFNACLATPENIANQIRQLRFSVGEDVECTKGEGKWSRGKVVQLMYRDDGMPPGFVAPYQIKLADGDLIYAPLDSDCSIRRPWSRSDCVRACLRGYLGGPKHENMHHDHILNEHMHNDHTKHEHMHHDHISAIHA